MTCKACPSPPSISLEPPALYPEQKWGTEGIGPDDLSQVVVVWASPGHNTEDLGHQKIQLGPREGRGPGHSTMGPGCGVASGRPWLSDLVSLSAVQGGPRLHSWGS